MSRTQGRFLSFFFAIFITTCGVSCCAAHAQAQAETPPSVHAELSQPYSQPDPQLAADIVARQLGVVRRGNAAYRYLLRRSDEHGTVIRDEIVTPTGRVGRIVSREDKPLTREEDEHERSFLDLILNTPSEQHKKQKDDEHFRKLTEELVSAMPHAMVYTLRPGQPQLPQFQEPQIVIDYRPNPDWHPASTAQEGLTGLDGTMWLDKTHHVLRMEGHVSHTINLVMGIVARIYPGGNLVLEQTEYAPGKYAYSLLTMDLQMRELMVHTAHVQSSQHAYHFVPLPDGTTLADATRMLLADHPAVTEPGAAK